ncbi:MAG: tetratricopeptide repeat protein, partial [Casimicrobium sp.]
ATWALVFKMRDIAIERYEKILAIDPAHALTRARLAFLYAEAGDGARAIREFETVVKQKPEDSDTWFNLGYLLQENNRHHEAIAAFDSAIKYNERQDRAWYGKAISLIALKRDDDAVTALRKNVELQPMSPYGHMELARCYFRLGDNDRCEKQMRKLKAFDPKNAAALEDETGIKIGIERWWKN